MTDKNKTVDTIQSVEQKIMEKLEILKNGETKAEKIKARKEIIHLEQHLKNVREKIQNGKHYPEKRKPKEMTKAELLKLIDSVETPEQEYYNMEAMGKEYLDLSGVFVK